MFSVITNIYNKKNQRIYLNGIVHSQRKTEKVFLTSRDVRCMHHGWHGTRRYDIQVLAKNLNIVSIIDVCRVTRGAHIEHLYL